MVSDRASEAASRIAGRINGLIAKTLGASGHPLSNREIAERARAAGFELSGVYLAQLRRGQHLNPTLRALEAVAVVFGVDVSYLLSPEEPTVVGSLDPDLAAALDDQGVRALALRALTLSQADRATVLALMQRLPGSGDPE